MTANAPRINAVPQAPGTVPVYRAHITQQLPGAGFTSIGDRVAGSDNASGGSGSDEPISRAQLFSTEPYDRPFGRTLNTSERQLGRYWMRRIMKEHYGRSDMSGLY